MKIKDIEVNYIQYGNKKGKEVVLLHGWGQNIEMMEPIGKSLEDICHITNIDLPGFGRSEEPSFGSTIYDYFAIIDELLIRLEIINPVLIGHSFGGSIAIVYASQRKVDKLILLAAPFKRTDSNKSIKTKILKFLKKVPVINLLEGYAKSKLGSTDYKNANYNMRSILINVVNEDLTESLKQIEWPTLLIWGTNDMASPFEDAKYAESIMKDAGLVEFTGCSHYAYLERLDTTIKVIKEFIKN